MGLSYVIDECPPWYLSIVLGFQVTSPVHKHLKPIETRHITTSWPYLTHAHSHTTIPSRSQTPCCLVAGKEPFLIWWSGQETVDADQRIATSGIEIRDVSYLRPSPESRRLDDGVRSRLPDNRLLTACMSPHQAKLQKHIEVLFICFATIFLRVYRFHSQRIEICIGNSMICRDFWHIYHEYE